MPLLKKILRTQLISGLCLLCGLCLPAQAGETHPAVRQTYHIRQKTLHKNGVFVSQPHSLDIQIKNFIYQADINSIEDYAVWLKKNIKYQKSAQPDSWVSPIDILNRKWGDCDDFALLNSSVVRVLGYQPRFLALFRAKRAHAVCTFQSRDYIFWFDNAEIKKTQAKTMQDFVKLMMSRYKCSRILELDLETMQWKAVPVTAS